METQEYGEMMEHVDEVNFAMDGLRKGQPVRIMRASLLSLLSICGMPQQRRLLRAHGMAKTIIDAILGLSFDDSPSNLAGAAIFYILTSDPKIHDELIAREIVINDAESAVRYKLTKRQTQEEIQNCTGAVIITRSVGLQRLSRGPLLYVNLVHNAVVSNVPLLPSSLKMIG